MSILLSTISLALILIIKQARNTKLKIKYINAGDALSSDILFFTVTVLSGNQKYPN